MATVRIYKVAELLGTTSQEVLALLKRDHAIQLKSASSTIEEVVGRQFVERLARQRGIQLPGGDMFAEAPPAKGKKAAASKKAEPPKPLAPALPPPRLVKTVRPPAPPAAAEPVAAAEEAAVVPAESPVAETAAVAPAVEAPAPAPPAAVRPVTPGRLVPPSIRLGQQ